MKALKVLAVAMLAAFSVTAANAQHRKVVVVRHRVVHHVVHHPRHRTVVVVHHR